MSSQLRVKAALLKRVLKTLVEAKLMETNRAHCVRKSDNDLRGGEISGRNFSSKCGEMLHSHKLSAWSAVHPFLFSIKTTKKRLNWHFVFT